ncbi:MAG: DNA repair protein RecN, partial [Bacteroidales bacterium]
MILHLYVHNYVLIDSLDIEFDKGFTTITGETGAGKSVIIGALGLILGERADTSTLLNHKKKCIIEGSFQIETYGLQSFFQRQDIDYDPYTIIRREILPSGKSRAFVNDTPVKLTLLRSLGEKLINIHSQHASLTLNRADFQLGMLDDYAQNSELLAEYQNAYHEYLAHQKALFQLQEKSKNAKAEQDYYRFLFDELENARLGEGEKEQLEKDMRQMNHVEQIKEALYYSGMQLSGSENNILDAIKEIEKQLMKAAPYHARTEKMAKRMESVRIELEDISAELEHAEESVVYDPAQQAYINDRLDLIYALEQKHQVEGSRALLERQAEIGHKLQQVESLEESISRKEKRVAESKAKARQLAEKLHKIRLRAAPHMSKAIKQLLHSLNMEDASIQMQVAKKEQFNESGYDHVSLLFSANKGQDLAAVQAAASDTELSRLMLAAKCILSSKTRLPSIVFDEIDSGVSGNAAAKVGQ